MDTPKPKFAVGDIHPTNAVESGKYYKMSRQQVGAARKRRCSKRPMHGHTGQKCSFSPRFPPLRPSLFHHSRLTGPGFSRPLTPANGFAFRRRLASK
jgi:hypothetical protein